VATTLAFDAKGDGVKRTLLLILIVAAAAAVGSAVAAPNAAASGCRTTSTSGGSSPFTMATSATWCWNGGYVTSVSPAGGSTYQSAGGWYAGAYFQKTSAARWSYCCVGWADYTINKTGRWVCTSEWWTCQSTYLCVRNNMHFYADGHYSTAPSGVYGCGLIPLAFGLRRRRRRGRTSRFRELVRRRI
jgi:hypothetical protein